MKIKVLCTHLSLFVSDPDASARWYADVLGMRESARSEGWVMMSFDDRIHDIGLIRAEKGAHHGGLGLQHYGLEIEGDMTILRELYGMLLDKGVDVVRVADHEIGNGIYFNDPDGNRLEFFLQTEPDDVRAKERFRETGAPSRDIEFKRL
jgi:catechol 2,3-dioxygenase-like lactoylglutathione lyase family enzyme